MFTNPNQPCELQFTFSTSFLLLRSLDLHRMWLRSREVAFLRVGRGVRRRARPRTNANGRQVSLVNAGRTTTQTGRTDRLRFGKNAPYLSPPTCPLEDTSTGLARINGEPSTPPDRHQHSSGEAHIRHNSEFLFSSSCVRATFLIVLAFSEWRITRRRTRG